MSTVRRPFLMLMVLAGCAPVDRASVLISPPARPAAGPFPAANPEPGIRSAFERHAGVQGSRCHAAVRQVGRLVCRGPKDLHLTFEPRLNGSGYVAGLSWVRSDGRSAEEFRQLVRGLEQALQAAGASVEVRMGQFAE